MRKITWLERFFVASSAWFGWYGLTSSHIVPYFQHNVINEDLRSLLEWAAAVCDSAQVITTMLSFRQHFLFFPATFTLLMYVPDVMSAIEAGPR